MCCGAEILDGPESSLGLATAGSANAGFTSVREVVPPWRRVDSKSKCNPSAIEMASPYVKFLPALAQRTIRSPHDGHPVAEGCGPIAVAMCIMHWRRCGYMILPLLESRRSLVRGLYDLLGAYRRVGGSFTPPTTLYAGMKRIAEGSALVAHHLRPRPWRIMKQVLCHQLRKRRPVIILVRQRPECLDGKEESKKGWHYVVACGYKGNTLRC